MDYYYDVLLNFNEYYFMFYEWDKDDLIECVKKIPIKHVDSNVMIDILTNKINADNEFLNDIKNKTKLKDNKLLKYACIFSDGKNALAIEFNDKGESINKSSLLLDDEINVNEFMYNINLIDLKYHILKKDTFYNETRQDRKIRNLIKIEIDNLYKNRFDSKLQYIYLEWFNKLENEREVMYQTMIDKLKSSMTKKEYDIYELIKKSYNNV